MRDYASELERCDTEIAEAATYSGPEGIGACIGWADWMTERALLLEQMEAE